ncbi:ankyrin [Pseudovirgaria hyperparasitica]|uniref:Ankyrin n=1 Tax=Pseudovirgaria hyperparasitica TaxID=470096 RepID=A0A6A6WCA3_9PEZI|nr:ankyrin [Pseudovirgaria hyperparasitica]KAF2758741.1 ankyrin [Pseudovirgaria hyperparasitica]
MADIWQDARSASFTKEKLLNHIQERGEDIVNEPDQKLQYTPLVYAINSMRFRNVELLLSNKADPEKPVGDGSGETPMYFAASLTKNGARIVQQLLSKRARNFDEPTSTKKETPLMRAVAVGRDPEVVKLLVRNGASLQKKNSDGKTAADLAAEIQDPDTRKKIQDALKTVPDRDRGGVLTYFSNWAVYVLKFFNRWTPLGSILAAASNVFYKVAGSKIPELPDGETVDEPKTVEDFKNNLQDAINENGLGRFYDKPGDTYLDDVAKQVFDLKNDPSNPLQEPPELQGLANLALYQPVIYCDDSASMRDDFPSNGENRWPRQRGLVKRITEITNRAVPNKRGIFLRFQNNPMAGAGMMGDEVDTILTAEPSENNWTPIGSGLKKNVLQPLVYDVVSSGKELERPLLILMTTDGCPWCQEDAKDGIEDKISIEYGFFRDNIVECMDFLKEHNYRRDTVIFCLNQIGSHPDATWFMGALEKESKLSQVLYLTAERLDDKFDDLQENARNLETWLLEILLKPLTSIYAP